MGQRREHLIMEVPLYPWLQAHYLFYKRCTEMRDRSPAQTLLPLSIFRGPITILYTCQTPVLSSLYWVRSTHLRCLRNLGTLIFLSIDNKLIEVYFAVSPVFSPESPALLCICKCSIHFNTRSTDFDGYTEYYIVRQSGYSTLKNRSSINKMAWVF